MEACEWKSHDLIMPTEKRPLQEVAMDRNRMLLIGSAVVLVLLIAYMMFGPSGISVPR